MSASVTKIDDLLEVPAACAALHISRSKLYQLVREGSLRAVKIGTKTLFRASTLQAFIEASETVPEESGRRFNANIKGKAIGAKKLVELDGQTLEAWFAERVEAGAKASHVNGHRRIIRAVFNCLIRHRLFRGTNPVKETKPLPEEEFPHELLTEEEFWRIVPHLTDYWRDLAIISFTTGLRRGEIYALRRDRNVVDLANATLTPRGSNQWGSPKGKAVKSIPLFPESLAIFQRAWDAAADGDLLFPGVTGGLRSSSSRAAEAIRRAMRAAGLAKSWTHVCRRRACSGKLEGQPDEQQRACPECGSIMWPKPQVRSVRFHDLRHSCAAYLLDRGVDLFTVSQLLRHSTIEITRRYYANRTVHTLRRSLDQHDPFTLQRQLERLAQANPEMAADLRSVAEKAAQTGHQNTNVVPLNIPNRG